MELGGAKREVHFISMETIRPATRSDATKRLQLTPWDLSSVALYPAQMGLFFNKPKQDDATWLTNLKTSLSRTLDHYLPLAGRLATETHEKDNTMSVFVQCNNAGAEFLHATADITVSDVLGPSRIPCCVVDDLFHLNGSINYDGRSKPLLAIQVTELVDGVCIGCTMNHCIADGESFWHFINAWTEICKTGCNQISRSPNFDRCSFKAADLPVRIPISSFQNMVPYIMAPLEERRFHFAPHNIAKLKAMANQEINNNNVKVNVISSLQAVLAHMWIAVTRARNLDPNQEVYYMLAINNRSRLNPPLSEDYFGNSVNLGIARVKTSELMSRGVGFAAGLLNQAVSCHTHAEICSAWENWVKEPTIFSLKDLVGNIALTGSSPRFNMYETDFGWGCPIRIRSPSDGKVDGEIRVNPGKNTGKGSMEIETCLSPETMQNLAKDPHFLQFVGATDESHSQLGSSGSVLKHRALM